MGLDMVNADDSSSPPSSPPSCAFAYLQKCNELCPNHIYVDLNGKEIPANMAVDVADDVGTFSCGCCIGGTVSPPPKEVEEEASVSIDFSAIPVWAWLVIICTPILLWVIGGLAAWRLSKKKKKTTDELNESLDTDAFEFPFGQRFLVLAETSLKQALCTSAGFKSFLQHKALYLHVERGEDGQTVWRGTTIKSFLYKNAGLVDLLWTYCSKRSGSPRKGLYRGGWRTRGAFNFLFGLALSIAFGTVALDMESTSSCKADCDAMGSCSTSSTSFSSGGGGISLPSGSASFMTTTGLFISVINVPTKVGMSFTLKKLTRLSKQGSALPVVYFVALVLGFGAVALSIYYLTSLEESTAFSMGSKIAFCVILTLSQAGIGVLAIDGIGQLLLLYLPARCLLKSYEGTPAHPRQYDQELGRRTVFGSVLTAGVSAAADSLADSTTSGGPTLETIGSAAATAAKEIALDAATLKLLAKLRPKLEPIAEKRGVEWEQVQSAATELNVEDLEAAADDPEAFFVNRLLPAMKEAALDAATLKLLAKLRSKLEPIAEKRGVEWEQVQSAATELNVEDLVAAVDDPEAFLDKLDLGEPSPDNEVPAETNSAAETTKAEAAENKAAVEAKTRAAKEASASASAGGKAAANVAEKADATREEAQPRLPTAAPPVPRTSTPDARVSPPKPPPPPAPADAVKTKQPSPGSDYLLATFAAGPLGLGLKNSNGQVKVTSVDAGLTAEAQGVVEGSIVHEVNGQSTQGLDKAGVIKLITAAARPLTIKFTEDETEDMI